MNWRKWFLAVLLSSLLVLLTGLPALAAPTAAPLPPGSPPLYIPFVLRQYAPPPAIVRILPNYFSYVYLGSLHILGEVENDTDAPVRSVRVNVNVNDSGGHTLASDFDNVTLNVLPSGAKTCFHISLPEPAGWKAFIFPPMNYSTGGTPITGLQILNPSGVVEPTFKWYELTGEVQNNGVATMSAVWPIATLYNQDGKVVGCDWFIAVPSTLAPAQKGTFSITFYDRDYSDVTNYVFQVSAMP